MTRKMQIDEGEDTDLCVLTQVDPFGDVVDGGDPLVEEAAQSVRQQESDCFSQRVGKAPYLLAFLPALRLQRHHPDETRAQTKRSFHLNLHAATTVDP